MNLLCMQLGDKICREANMTNEILRLCGLGGELGYWPIRELPSGSESLFILGCKYSGRTNAQKNATMQ